MSKVKEKDIKIVKFSTQTWYSQTYDIPMTLFISRFFGRKRREKFAKEVNEYRERVVEREHERVAKIISKKFKQSEKSVMKLLNSKEASTKGGETE